MQVFEKIGPLRDTLAGHRNSGKRIGLVPTMGYLHDGHATLIRRAVEECDVVVCSVFVNPQQFNNTSDLSNYPKSWDKDLKLARGLGCQIMFKPGDDEMYPQEPLVRITTKLITTEMEGVFRPGHFEGVALIVVKLLNIVAPDVAYFGQKDLQQLALVRQLTLDLNIPVKITGIPTQRDASGLALSSRNARLSSTQKAQAANIYKALMAAGQQLEDNSDVSKALGAGLEILAKAEINPEYFNVVNSETFQPMQSVEGSNQVAICTAATIGEVRLIDNIIVQLTHDD